MSTEDGLPDEPSPRWRRVISIGECMVEMAPRADGSYVMGFAGDTFNTAWYLRELCGPDVSIAYLTAVGEDAVSDRMLAFMADAGIETGHVARRGDATVGLYLVALERGERTFSYWRENSAARTLDRDLGAVSAAGSGSLIYFSGITLAILSADGRARLMAAVREARGAGACVAFDPNIRPRLWETDNSARHWVERAARDADFAFPSYDDERALFGDRDMHATATRYLRLGARCVVVKNGPRPVIVRAASGATCQVAPRDVQPIDTTAAGDAFNAGFLSATNAGAGIAEAAQAGCRLSARVIRGHGALVSPDVNDLAL